MKPSQIFQAPEVMKEAGHAATCHALPVSGPLIMRTL